MKVAVSIPDAVFSEAEDLAKRLKASRSEIYSRALGEFLARHAPDRVTETMNDAIAAVGERRAVEPAEFPNELEGSSSNLLVRRRRAEIK